MGRHKAEDEMRVGGLQFYRVSWESLTEVTFQQRIEIREGMSHVDICREK